MRGAVPPPCHSCELCVLTGPAVCAGCGEAIYSERIAHVGGGTTSLWHQQCVVCADCGRQLTHSCHMMDAGLLYCELHFYK